MKNFLFFVVAFIGAVLCNVRETASDIYIPVQDCGIRNASFNTQGRENFPWLVKLIYDDNKVSRCGGVLVSDQWVLSSAACIRSDELQAVMVGGYDTTNNWDCLCIDANDSLQMGYIRNKIFNNEYEAGLLKLFEPVRINEYVSPICIPLINDYILAFMVGRVSGWSYLDGHKQLYNGELQSTNMVVMGLVDNSVCNYFLNTTIPWYKFCARNTGTPKPCLPIPGGPFIEFWERNGRYYATGIMLEEVSECDTTKPIVFLHTRHVHDWIKNTIQNESC